MEKAYFIGTKTGSTELLARLKEEREEAQARLDEVVKSFGLEGLYFKGFWIVGLTSKTKPKSTPKGLNPAEEVQTDDGKIWVSYFNKRTKLGRTVAKTLERFVNDKTMRARLDPARWIVDQTGTHRNAMEGRGWFETAAGSHEGHVIVTVPISKPKGAVNGMFEVTTVGGKPFPAWLIQVRESEFIHFNNEGGKPPAACLA